MNTYYLTQQTVVNHNLYNYLHTHYNGLQYIYVMINYHFPIDI